jgi:thioredoxin reductase (NADPH)
MATSHDPLGKAHDSQSNVPTDVQASNPDFRRDLAFQSLSDDMVDRLRSYGREEFVPGNVTLYTQGDRDSDMFIVLDGGIDVVLRSPSGGYKVFANHRRHQFSGEFSLLNSQRAVTEARTVMDSRLLRISRKELRLLMRSEGDIANIIVSAAIWRRIGMISDGSGAVVLTFSYVTGTASRSPFCLDSYSSSNSHLKSSAFSQLRVFALRRMNGPSDPKIPLIHFGQRQRL